MALDKDNSKLKRLVVDLPIEMHSVIKGRAAFRGMKIREWILLAIRERIKEEMRYE
jgi:hypothetical protein